MNRFGWLFGVLLSLVLGFASGCKESHDGGDTQTNWLKACTNSDECGAFECICGRCTQSCQAADDCQATPVTTTCQAAASDAAQKFCGDDAPPAGICMEPTSAMGPVAATDAADFCQRFAESYCAYAESCGCGAAATDKCRTTLASACQPGGALGGLQQAVAAGDLQYDAAAGDALLARLKEPGAPCVGATFRNLRLTSDELYSWAGTFIGTKALGQACSSPVGYKGGFNDCAEGVCAAADESGGGGTCIALVGLGEACDASGDHNLKATTARLCFDARPADSDGEYESAFDSLSCVPSGAGGNVCSRELALGQPCNNDEACSSGHCRSTGVRMGECAEPLADGQPCISGGDCISGSCPSDPMAGSLCAPPRADGQPCSLASQCTSGGCYDTGAGSEVCAVPLARAIGETCASDTDCATDVCRMGTCWADICANYLEPSREVDGG